MRIATWNVNGIRARQGELLSWLAAERPEVVCLQEIKASVDQLPFELRDVDGYTVCWHGERGYSGVGLLVWSALADGLTFSHPAFDFEQRIVRATIPALDGLTVVSVYVPNGGKDFEAKLRFLDALDMWTLEASREPGPLVICGDLNVARTDRDIHPKERKPNQIGARENERALIERLLSRNLVDVGRALDPDNDNLFTWWAPWRNLKQRNIGWRIDYVMMSAALASRVRTARVQREVGSSDHGPVIVDLEAWPS